ncbi:MAG: response regulator [Candidatus Promineifilaceae bacterium]|nr:response regulator [Candidatus Promineifilaceae bacterium]
MPKKILVIDDHPETVELIELTLRRHGYDVTGVQSGAAGIKRAEAERPDLILLDIMMPDMDGLTVCRNIRENEDLKQTPVIMFTAKTQAQEKLMGFEAGADDYLTKPTRPDELIARVEAILARHEEERTGTGGPQAPAPEAEEGGDRRSIIAVLSARGGAGATTTAINLAVAMAEQGEETLLADLDVTQGHVGVYLNEEVRRDIVDWANSPAEKLAEELSAHIIYYSERLRLLLSDTHLTIGPGALGAARMGLMTEALAKSGYSVVVDLGLNVTENVRPLLQEADYVLICLRPERAAITAARRMLSHLRKGIGRENAVMILMLDFGSGSGLPKEAVEKYLGHRVHAAIMIDPRQIARAVNQARPLVQMLSGGKIAQHFAKLAQQTMPARSGEMSARSSETPVKDGETTETE